jgi:hypothetical protein
MKIQRTALSRMELLVVIVIIIFVPSILMASLEAARELAKIPVCANQLRQIGLAVSLYVESYDGNMPWWGYFGYKTGDPYSGSEESHPYVAYRQEWVWPNGKLIPMRMACLYEAGLIKDPKIFYCPANKKDMFKYESYIKYKGKTTPWGFLPQDFNMQTNQWVRFGYTYFPTDPNGETFASSQFNDPTDPSKPLMVPKYVARKLDNLDPNIPYLIDMIHSGRDFISHNIQGKPGVNALFKDGHVIYCDDQSVFTDDVWYTWDIAGGAASWWRDFYYMVFKLIGQSCGPAK